MKDIKELNIKEMEKVNGGSKCEAFGQKAEATEVARMPVFVPIKCRASEATDR